LWERLGRIGKNKETFEFGNLARRSLVSVNGAYKKQEYLILK